MDRLNADHLLTGWIPTRLKWQESEALVEWVYLGTQCFREPFFEQTIEACLRRPFNLLFRRQTPMAELRRWHCEHPGLEPSGFIFHMSRCGSTLIAQLLAALPGSIVISEARPVDAVLRAASRQPGITEAQRIDWLRWMLSALGQPRQGNERRYFVKFDAWNALELSLVRAAFPTVPWIFVYRDPVEVLVSQLGKRGAHMVPGVIDPRLFGMDLHEAVSLRPEEYCARVLARICREGFARYADGGLLINYCQLPEAVLSTVADFFRQELSSDELEIAMQVAGRDAKNPAVSFESDVVEKHRAASAAVLEVAARWLYPVYEELEEARLSTTHDDGH
jgi:hypothetical protein